MFRLGCTPAFDGSLVRCREKKICTCLFANHPITPQQSTSTFNDITATQLTIVFDAPDSNIIIVKFL